MSIFGRSTEDPTTPELQTVWTCLFQVNPERWVGVQTVERGQPIDPQWRSSQPMSPEEMLEIIQEACGKSSLGIQLGGLRKEADHEVERG